jgi:hypothetical protein
MADFMADFSAAELAELRDTITRLRASRGVLVRAADLLGGLIGGAASQAIRRLNLSPTASPRMQGIAEAALRRASVIASRGLPRPGGGLARQPLLRTRLLAVFSGTLGGLAGLPGFLPDAGFTTLLIMRAIAAIAVAEGEDLTQEASRAACLEVFAFGGPPNGPTSSIAETPDTGYWTARLLLQGRPLVRLFADVATRYGLHISEKLALQAIPLVGAAGGAAINSLFLDHYTVLARVHFTLRRLERQHGATRVRDAAEAIGRELRRA